MIVKVKDFVQFCMHCIILKASGRISRLLASSLHGQKPSGVVPTDSLYTGNSDQDDLRYILLTKDDLSSYT